MQEDLEIINQCTDFLKRSSRRFGSALSRATKDLRRYSGNFWDDEFKKQYRSGKNRQCLSLNNWNVICNAIASPMSASPWHTELKDKTGELKNVQEAIDALEADNDVKNALLDSFRKAVLSGYGFLVVSTDKDELTDEAKIILESVKHLQSVALDPACCSTTGEDAEEGAIVNFISLRKAKRLYGEDVVPMNYPQTRAALDLNDMEQWGCPADQTAIVSYYVKENEGVHFYKICGDKIVQSDVLPIKFIPIIRIAGNEIYDKEDINYNGIIQLTLNLELGANIAYSTLIERCGQLPYQRGRHRRPRKELREQRQGRRPRGDVEGRARAQAYRGTVPDGRPAVGHHDHAHPDGRRRGSPADGHPAGHAGTDGH